MKFSLPKRYFLFARLSVVFFFIQILFRTILACEKLPSIGGLVRLYAEGMLWDTLGWSFLLFPLYAFLSVLPEKFAQRFDGGILGRGLAFVLISVLAFVGFCELTFWSEFHSRFNFIAVDYLVYTNEVLANLRESYPMHWIFTGVFIAAGILTVLVEKVPLVASDSLSVGKRFRNLGLALTVPAFFGFIVGPVLNESETNFRNDQLARNGWVEFYRAFRSNQIDYKNFYPTIEEAKAEAFVHSKRIAPATPVLKLTEKPNVVMIVVESLGAKFIGPLGGKKDVTPFLNALSDRSVFFENLYATGTRTVRGLEAINLSVPPTPGYAVVKRPNHKNLFSLGNTFKNNGYDPIFLYGGRGFFDNMNSFFEGNGFSTIDQGAYSESEVTFSNAWGVCDEDMFRKALTVLDRPSAGKPKLLFMLTTSNHRPFTYPEGKIDIPSGTGRLGAVKYTDYAIGKFLTEAEAKPWAKNTIFIVIADHSTEGRGRFDLEMSDFHIPMWIYAPAFLKPERMKQLVSQIDLLPSLIHLLGLKDQSPFFGKSFFAGDTEERAFIGNYQYVGYYKDHVLTTLGPNRKSRSYTYDPVTKKQKDSAETKFTEEGISYYQYASDLLKSGKYNVGPDVNSAVTLQR